jgi:L-2,4-diaminobutyrate decarboxylase
MTRTIVPEDPAARTLPPDAAHEAVPEAFAGALPDVLPDALPDAFATVRAALDADATADAAASFVALVADYLADAARGDGPVSRPEAASVLFARLPDAPPRTGRPLDALAATIARDLLPHVNRLVHPMSLGHQVAAPLPAAVWTEALVSALNQSLAVREMSPAFTPLEHRVVRWFTDIIGWDGAAGGTLTSGGTEATFTALLAARSHAIPDVWTRGLGADPPVLLCGEHAHYAVTRAAGAMGLGLDRVLAVPSRDHAMDPAALDRMLHDLARTGRRAMAVVATAGCTATGTFDDLEAIADVCDAHDTWLHVDAAHGGAAMLVPSHAHRVRGLARARSVAWDPHKTLFLPLAAGLVLVRDARVLDAAFSQRAPYLFAPDADEPRAWDLGPRSFLCSRRGDVLKLWVALERYGLDGLAALYAHVCDVATHLHARLDAHPDFTPCHVPQSNILCFAYTPAGAPCGADAAARATRTDALRAAYNGSGAGWITATTLDGERVLRVTVMNPRTTPAHVDRLVDGLAATAHAGR